MNVLVTGGSGFIASHLVDKLVELGNFVVNLDKLDYCSFDNTESIPNKYKFIQGNICNKELVSFILKEYKITVIFHLAAQTHVDNSFFNSTQFTMDNVVGTHNLLECTREYGKIEKFIHMSTDEVYGEVPEGEDERTETSILKPTNPYSASKAGAELLVASYYKSFKLPCMIIRCNNVFGPRQYPEKVIPAFIYNILRDDKCYIHGEGNTERHFIYVEDVVNALLCIYDKGAINEIYNIATDKSLKIIELAHILIKKIKNTDNYEEYIYNVEDRKFNDYRYLINSEKLFKLGWNSKVSFEDGLERTLEYYKTIKEKENFNLN